MSQVANSHLRALYVDFNSYFASAEQQMRPELRGQPIGIVAVMTPSTCCIAASVEAKRFGVKTGTGVRDAKRLCPEIQFVEARPEEYIRLHHRLHEVIESCLPVTAVRSIDEMWCELKGSDRLRANAERLAIQIKEKIYSEVGDYLRCSIGIAPNRYLAKTASNMQKPNGLVVIEKLDLPQVLFRLSLRDLNGIGHAMNERLIANGIDSVEKLCMASKLKLRKAWGGIEGERMWARLRGEWVPDPATEKSSVSHSHVLPPEYRDYTGAFSVAHRLLQRAAAR
jgi:DNA polymerase-4